MFLAAFNNQSKKYKKTAPMTIVHACNTEFFADANGDMRQRERNEETCGIPAEKGEEVQEDVVREVLRPLCLWFVHNEVSSTYSHRGRYTTIWDPIFLGQQRILEF